MKKEKHINTLGLIQKMAQQNKGTTLVLKNLKNERTVDKTGNGSKQQFESKNVNNTERSVVVGEPESSSLQNKPGGNRYAIQQFELFLNTEHFSDRKEPFVLSLSKDCMGKYEKLANGASYKLGIKTHRNDLMRKVLEDFIKRKYQRSIQIIEQQ